MAFDFYVGSFARYYTGDWENVMQAMSREQGVEYMQITPGGNDDGPQIDADELREIVGAFQSALTESLGDNIDAPLKWDETERSPYFTDRPGWGGYAAVLLLAAYADHPNEAFPARLPENFFDDPILSAARDDDFRSRFPTLLRCDLWLPGEFAFGFTTQDLVGETRRFGSVGDLAKDLARLGDEVLAATEADAVQWAHVQPTDEVPLLELARFGWSVWHRLARDAKEHHLPFLLDF